MWRKAWKLKEEALRTIAVKNSEMLNQRVRELQPLYVGSVYYRTRAALIRVNGTSDGGYPILTVCSQN